jgi:hypothetical protein
MRISIIAEEELTHKVFAGLKNNFAMSGLGRSPDVLLDKGVNALATISAVADGCPYECTHIEWYHCRGRR